MNKIRRGKISELIKALEHLNSNFSLELLNQCMNALEDIKNEEEEAFDSMPEGLQYSQRGMDSEAAIDNFEEALGYLEEAYETEDIDERETNIGMAIDSLEDTAI